MKSDNIILRSENIIKPLAIEPLNGNAMLIYEMNKRIFDITMSGLGLMILSPFFLLIAIAVKLSSKGPVFYSQKRVGRLNRDFKIFKFRTMKNDNDDDYPLTVGEYDKRVTPLGRYLRRYKLDELPQLFNVLIGDMSLVGPRPVLRKFVNYYTSDDMQILDVRPGITDYASIKYRHEGRILAKAEDPLEYYLRVIMPDKIKLNKLYIQNMSFAVDIKLILNTLVSKK